jgi:hypothetical protein
MADAPVSFAADIRGVLYPYRDQMMWRLDLTSYADVKANAAIILPLINSTPAQMPPPPFPGFSADFIATFTAWTTQGCPP